MSEKSIYETLSSINVSKDIESKNGFSYLSWARAWHHLKKHYPLAKVGVNKFDGKPYLRTEMGCFIEAYCDINGHIETELMPVLDFKNKPITNPNAFDVNKSIKRAIVKAIALQGLGLYIYAGEDLPSDEREAIEHAKTQLREILTTKGMYQGKQTDIALNKLSYDELRQRIDKYTERGE